MNKKIGKIIKCTNLSDEYFQFAQQDEKAALSLKKSGFYRQSRYFIVQAMEKYIRAKIFQRLNPDNKYVRDFNKDHSLEKAIDVLISSHLSSKDTIAQEHIKSQLLNIVNGGGVKSAQLHNNLRYPFFHMTTLYSSKYEITDVEIMEQKLNNLKKYLDNLHLI